MMLCDSIQKYNYDGMDVDYEPSFASPFKQGNHCGDWNAKDLVDHIALISCSSTSNKERENYFFTRMREELDKREAVMGKELMFNINGSLSYIDEKVAPLFDFFVAQSYHSAHSSWSTSLNRFAHLGITPQKQLLLTETFENNEANAKGFDEYADFLLNGGGTPKAAGIGAYHINADKRFGANEEAGEYYLNVRRVIQKLNPSMVPED